MSKRIDLTQFERMMKGPWELKTYKHGRNGMEERPEPNYNSTEVRKSLQAFSLITTFSGKDKVNAGYNQYSSIHFPSSFYDSDWKKVSLATARALAAAPDLVAELKKMYAREDELLDALRIIILDLDNQPTGPNGDIFEHIEKIRNFANDSLLGMSVDKPKCRNCGATTNLHQNRFDKKHDCGACLQELQDMNDFDSQHTL